MSSHYDRKKFLLLILGTTAIAWLMVADQTVPRVEERKAVVTKIDLTEAKTPEEKLPSQFPKEIPIEEQGIIDSHFIEYPFANGRTSTQMTVSYNTEFTKQQKYKEYLDFMKKEGYEIRDSNSETGFLYGIMHTESYSNDLSISISEINNKVTVNISFLQR